MVEAIKKIVLRLLPELKGQYHLPRFGRVVGISDPPTEHGLSTNFRPFYAADIEVLDAHGKADKTFPILKSIPLPVPQAGMEAGQFAFPKEGSRVVLHFAYGLPHQPFISQILPQGQSLPKFDNGDLLWSHSDEVLQKCDRNGNWYRKTNGTINDASLKRSISSVNNEELHHSSTKTIAEHCKELVKGIKKVEALGALRLISGGTANLSALDNLNITTASDLNEVVAKNKKTTIRGDKTVNVQGSETKTIDGSLTEDVGGIRTTTITGTDSLTAASIDVTSEGDHTDNAAGDRTIHAVNVQLQADGSAVLSAPLVAIQAPTIVMGGGGVDVLGIVSGLLTAVEELAIAVSSHNHTSSGTSVPVNSASIDAAAVDVAALNVQLTGLMP